MAGSLKQILLVAAALALLELSSCKEINSTQDLNKEETHEIESPWQFDDSSGSRSKSYSSSSSKSYGEGKGTGTGYGGNQKSLGQGQGYGGSGSGAGYKGATSYGGGHQKGKVEAYSYEKPDSDQSYGGPYQKPGSYAEEPSSGSYGQGYDDRRTSGYSHQKSNGQGQSYGGQGYGGPTKVTSGSYTSPSDSDPQSYNGGSSAEQGDIKAEYVDYYPGQNSHSNTQSHSTSYGSGSGSGSGGGSSKRAYRKEFRKQGFQTLGKDQGQPLSVYIKQLGTPQGSHSGESSSHYGGQSEGVGGQKGYLLLPVIPNENSGGSGYKSEAGGSSQGYIDGSSGEKASYGYTGAQQPQNLYSGEHASFFDTGKQAYDLANNGQSFHSNDASVGGPYNNGPINVYGQNQGENQGKYQEVSPKPYKQQQQNGYSSGGLLDGGNYKQPSSYEQPAEKFVPVSNYDKPQELNSYRGIGSPGSNPGKAYGDQSQGYGPAAFDFGSHGISANGGGGYNGNVNYRATGEAGPEKPRKVLVHDSKAQGRVKNHGLSYESRMPGAVKNSDIELKPINPNLYTQRQPIDVLPEIPFLPENLYSAQLNNFPVQRQIINHGPMGVSVSYKSLGGDLAGLDGLEALHPFNGPHGPVGIGSARHPQQLVPSKPFAAQLDARVRQLKNVQPQFKPKTKSIAIFLQKPNQYRASGGFSPIEGGLAGKLSLRGAGDVVPFDFLHGLNGMGSSLMPLSLPFGFRPLF